jgi:hypothetical protein
MHRQLLLRVCVIALLVSAPAAAGVINVPPDGDLQEAIARARPGDTIVLASGATYVGNFVLPVTNGDAFITIRTAADDAELPAEGMRITPADAARLAKLRSPNRQPVLRTDAGAHHWHLQWLEFLPTQDGHGDIIALGDGGKKQSRTEDVPHHLVIDRCYIHGDPTTGQKRGIALNSAHTTIVNSYISEIKAVGQDTQAIGGWNGPGPFRVENNYLEGAGENFILGGSDPTIEGLVPEDLVFRRNHLAKPEAWRSERWQVKNLFELKNTRRALIEENLFENVWKDAQVGYAILFTPRNQDGGAPWTIIEDVTFRRNIIRNAGGGVQITGIDNNYPSGRTNSVQIVDNLFYGIDAERWGGTGAFLMIGDGPRDITIERNTVIQSGNIITAFGGAKDTPMTIPGFIFRANVVLHNRYGVHGEGRGVGHDALATFFPGAVFTGNIIAGGQARLYPEGNRFVSRKQFDDLFVDTRAEDFRLKNPIEAGADVAAILARIGHVPSRGRRGRPSGDPLPH